MEEEEKKHAVYLTEKQIGIIIAALERDGEKVMAGEHEVW